ncbi:MAG TPA: ATP-grasp domain-containing protein, partial [Longimicrobiales bacterium]
MRILLLEYVTGGGLAGRPCPASLAREGAAMRDALLQDLTALPGVELTVSVDPRFPVPAPCGAHSAAVKRRDRGWLQRLVVDADAVWLIAPETGGRLARLAALVESSGRMLLGPASSSIRRAAHRARLLRRLARAGVPVPESWTVAGTHICQNRPAPSPPAHAFPFIVKPGRGAGGAGVTLVRQVAALPAAIEAARAVDRRAAVLLQRYLPGLSASVSLVCDGARALPLALNAQLVRLEPFAYHGGVTPLAHPLASRALEVAVAACQAVPGLRGYVGVDLVLTEAEAVVLEINPRLTTSYLGL